MKALRLTTNSEIALLPIDSDWDILPAAKRKKAEAWAPLVSFICEHATLTSSSISGMVDHFLLVCGTGDLPIQEEQAYALGRKGNPPSRASLITKCAAYKKHGIIGLAPSHKGSERQIYGWEVRALRYWQKPSKPSYQAITEWLQSDGIDNVNYNRVRGYIQSLPSDFQMRGRMGAKLFNNTQKSYIRRTTENLLPGQVYQGDGNTLDIYMQHPVGHKVWRAELTLWIDVASRYVVGWYVSEAESGNSTLFALSHALVTQDHIPAMLHIDNGSGYKNKMMSHNSNGFYARLGISVMHSLPYNAKGKGHVERFFGTMQRKFLKRFDSYCGADMDAEAAQRIQKEYKAGNIELPTRGEFCEKFSGWLEQYHNTPHRGLDGKTPNEVYATREQCPLENHSQAIFWPRTARTVRRSCVHFENREYGAPELIHYNTKKVTIEYSLHDDATVRILDAKQRWICDAQLINKRDYMPASRIDEAKQKRAIAQTKRLAVHQREIEHREKIAVTHDQLLADPVLTASTTDPITDNSDDINPIDQTSSSINIEDLF